MLTSQTKYLIVAGAAFALAACGGNSPASIAPVASQLSSVAHAQSLPATSPCLSSACIYVVGYDTSNLSLHNKLIYFASNANGNIPPLGVVTGGKTQLQEPQDVAVDSNHLVYVSNNTFGGDGSVDVYAAAPNGNVKPLRMFSQGDLYSPKGIATDGSSNIYVANISGPSGFGPGSVLVYAAGANGNPTPIQAISGTSTGLNSPYGLAVDAQENIYATNPGGTSGPSVTVYAAGANGNAAPIQTISGSNTGLGLPEALALDASKNIYVANAQFLSVTVYAAGANGNVVPIRTIRGAKTKMSRPYGVAVDAAGNVYVANTNNAETAAFITVYAAGANGNVKPIQMISGAATKLGGHFVAYGIAVR